MHLSIKILTNLIGHFVYILGCKNPTELDILYIFLDVKPQRKWTFSVNLGYKNPT